MSNIDAAVSNYYGRADLSNQILRAIKEAGINPTELTREHTETLDEMHVGGRMETRNLAEMAGLESGVHVLDLGSGIGGPARTIAEEFGCAVQGLDVTAEFCRAADMLTDMLHLSEQVRFRQGSATAIPFEDNEFEVVWMQHSGMNIPDKQRLYTEIARVLKPGGRFVLHEVLARNGAPIDLPVPWADRPEINHLANPTTLKATLEKLGFKEKFWNDVTPRSIEWMKEIKAKTESEGMPPLSNQVLFEGNFAERFANAMRNVMEDRLMVVQGCFVVEK